jgi:hypothetical protein
LQNSTNRYTEDLLRTRRDFKAQMIAALKCRTKKQKIALAAYWKKTYSDIGYKELIACAKDTRVRSNIANWEL